MTTFPKGLDWTYLHCKFRTPKPPSLIREHILDQFTRWNLIATPKPLPSEQGKQRHGVGRQIRQGALDQGNPTLFR